MALKVYKPQVFQGNPESANYFEGWYFKNVSSDLKHVYSFIPGISLVPGKSHSFIQVINGITGDSHYVSYPIDQFSWDKNKLEVKVGNSVFTGDGIWLDIEDEGLQVKGNIRFSSSVDYPRSLLSPGIMGWYSFVPFMECKHDVVSVNHSLAGRLTLNGEILNFSGGNGYIEKDWGRSFPKAWLWVHCNNFAQSDASLMISIADIPWLGSYFLGLIGFLYFKGEFFLFNTYGNAKIDELSNSGDSVRVTLRNKKHQLLLTIRKNTSGMLKAPVNGDMSRHIKESIDSEVDVILLDRDKKILFEDNGSRAGLEAIEAIFHYLK